MSQLILSYPPRRSSPRRVMLMEHLTFRGEYVEYGLPLPIEVANEILPSDVEDR